MTNIPIAFRSANHDDLPFFYSATLQAFYYDSPVTNRILSPTFFAGHKRVLGRLLRRPASRLIVACMEDDLPVIVGFALTEPERNLLHFIYVKKAFRQFGVGASILRQANMRLGCGMISHITNDLIRIAKKKNYTEMVYDPYVLMDEFV